MKHKTLNGTYINISLHKHIGKNINYTKLNRSIQNMTNTTEQDTSVQLERSRKRALSKGPPLDPIGNHISPVQNSRLASGAKTQ